MKQASCLSYFLFFCLQDYEHSNLPFFAKKTFFSKPGCSVLKAITVTALNFHILPQTDSEGFLVYCYLDYPWLNNGEISSVAISLMLTLKKCLDWLDYSPFRVLNAPPPRLYWKGFNLGQININILEYHYYRLKCNRFVLNSTHWVTFTVVWVKVKLAKH